MNRISQIAKTTAIAAALFAAPLAFGITVPQGIESTALVSSSAFNTPGLGVAPTLDIHESRNLRAAGLPMEAFLAENGANWEVRWDLRNNRPNLIQGQGIAIIAKDSKATVTLAEVERALRVFMEKNADLLGIRGLDLRLDKDRSVSYGGYYWTVEFQQFHQGVPVDDAHIFFRINHGNIVQFGNNRVAEVNVDAAARITSADALAAVTDRIGLKTSIASSRSTLKLFPIAAEGEAVYGERFSGDAGRGYDHVLAYEHIFTAKGSDEPFRTVTDAASGRVLEFRSELVFAQVTANIYPTTNTDPLQLKGLPFANVTNGTAKVTDAAGNYTFSAGTATSTLNGKYFRMADVCGAISLSNSTTGDLAFGGASGTTNCTTPGVGGAGNTHSSRTGFYHLTNINRKAASYLTTNSWLTTTVTANMNINQTCNAFWNGSTVNFYRSGGGCSNTGEIAAVFLHEWGHGMDTNSGGAATEAASGEAVGDTFAFLETKNGCIGNNFLPGSPCGNCNSSCTGVRDVAAFSTGGISTVARPSNVTSNTGINCDQWACPYTGYLGPMGYEGHCESYIASTANWDLQKQLNTALGNPAGWTKMDQIWYGSLTPSKSAYRVASGGQCNAAATVDGCGSNNWYTVYLSVDDDNGNLADGTPNGCRIWSAFNAHGISCGTQPACSGGGGGNTAPSVSITSPANGSSFPVGSSVSFTGTATDAQDGTLTSSLSWSSSINGSIGTGGSFSTSSLSAGTHTITASVTDTGSLTGSNSITVNITAGVTALSNGVPVTGLSGALNNQKMYSLAVPAGATNLSFTTTGGGGGDADLYVRFGSQPTTTTNDCASETSTSTETCSFATPSTGTYYALIHAFSAYSSLTLTGTYTPSGGGGPVTVTFYSVAAQDGRLFESTETSNVGGTGNSTDNTTASLRVGDFSDDTQYKTLVSFDTSSIPDTATITAATLRLKRGTISGTSPFSTHGTCTVDMSNAFGGSTAFAAADFQAAATTSGVATMSAPASDGTFSTGALSAAGRSAVNKTGTTQFRAYMTTDDNDDLGSDYIGFYSGEAASGNRPELVITYTP